MSDFKHRLQFQTKSDFMLSLQTMLLFNFDDNVQLLNAQVVFRSIHKLLMDTSTSEYLFCLEFFKDEGIYHELIEPTLGVVESSLAAQLTARCPCFPKSSFHRAACLNCSSSYS